MFYFIILLATYDILNVFTLSRANKIIPKRFTDSEMKERGCESFKTQPKSFFIITKTNTDLIKIEDKFVLFFWPNGIMAYIKKEFVIQRNKYHQCIYLIILWSYL